MSDNASSNNEEDGEDEQDEEDAKLGKLSEDDEPGWVMGTISKTAQHHMVRFQRRQMRLQELTQQVRGDAANSFHERDMKDGTAELMVPAVVKPQTDMTPATPLPTTFGEHMQTRDIVQGQSKMPQGTSRPGRSQKKLGSEKPQSHNDIASLLLDVVANSSPIENVMPVEPVCLDPCI